MTNVLFASVFFGEKWVTQEGHNSSPLVIKSNQDRFRAKNKYIALTGVNDAKMNSELV